MSDSDITILEKISKYIRSFYNLYYNFNMGDFEEFSKIKHDIIKLIDQSKYTIYSTRFFNVVMFIHTLRGPLVAVNS